MKPTDTIHIISTHEKKDGKRVLVEFKAVISWCEENDEYYYFGYEPINEPDRGSFGSAKLWKNRYPTFGVFKVVGTGEEVTRHRFTHVTKHMGPSYSVM